MEPGVIGFFVVVPIIVLMVVLNSGSKKYSFITKQEAYKHLKIYSKYRTDELIDCPYCKIETEEMIVEIINGFWIGGNDFGETLAKIELCGGCRKVLYPSDEVRILGDEKLEESLKAKGVEIKYGQE